MQSTICVKSERTNVPKGFPWAAPQRSHSGSQADPPNKNNQQQKIEIPLPPAFPSPNPRLAQRPALQKHERIHMGLYQRARVLAVAQSTAGRAAKRRWDETLRSDRPNPGWTSRLGDIERALGITAVAVGKVLELLGYRVAKHVTDGAVAVGCGVHRWDGFAMHDDWHLERAVAAIRSAAEVPGNPAVAGALAAAIAKQHGRVRVAARKRKQ